MDKPDFTVDPLEREIWCSAGKMKVRIGDEFRWKGVQAGKYKVRGWSGYGGYSPSGLGGTIGVIVENEKGEQIEWCGDSVARGIYDTYNT